MLKTLYALPLCLAPSLLMAEKIHLQSSISTVTVFGEGAALLRDVELALPAGQHRVLINLPNGQAVETLRVLEETGLLVNSISIDNIKLTSLTRANPARDAIEAQIDEANADIRALNENKAEINLIISAANARITLLRAIGNQQAVGATTPQGLSGEALSELVALVGRETLSALEDIQTVQLAMAQIDLSIKDVNEKLVDLNAAFEEASNWILLSVDVTTTAEFDGTFQLKYLSAYASWQPNYELHLNSETGALTIDRQVTLQQETGETWEGAEISVSTSQPSYILSYGDLSGRRASYFKPQPVMARDSLQGQGAVMFTAPSVVMMDEAAAMGGAGFQTNGLNASFTLPAGTIVIGDWSSVSVSVDQADLTAEISARAATYNQPIAFLFAHFTNETELPYLPGPAVLYRDGAYAGPAQMPSIALGQEIDMGFGVIEGLQVERRIVNRETGEAGVLTTRNDSIDEYEITVENLTGRDWDMIVYDRVPYSEQEDLEIDYSALPRPTDINVDGKRGVLAWEFPLAAGAETSIVFSYEMEWPEGTELQR